MNPNGLLYLQCISAEGELARRQKPVPAPMRRLKSNIDLAQKQMQGLARLPNSDVRAVLLLALNCTENLLAGAILKDRQGAHYQPLNPRAAMAAACDVTLKELDNPDALPVLQQPEAPGATHKRELLTWRGQAGLCAAQLEAVCDMVSTPDLRALAVLALQCIEYVAGVLRIQAAEVEAGRRLSVSERAALLCGESLKVAA